jgi:hypothetical protein
MEDEGKVGSIAAGLDPKAKEVVELKKHYGRET